MAGNGITGRDGDVKIGAVQISEIMKWSFNPKINLVKYASNKTGGYKQAIGGIKEGTGSLDGAWDPADPAYTPLIEGTSVTLKLYINATQFWSVPCIIESFTHGANIDAGELVAWSASFWSAGGWTAPVAALMMAPPPNGPEGLRAMGIHHPDQPVLTPLNPLQNEGETVQQAAARVADFYKTIKFPENLEEVCRFVQERMEKLRTPEGFDDIIRRASEKAAMDNVEAVADVVVKRLQDLVPLFKQAA